MRRVLLCLLTAAALFALTCLLLEHRVHRAALEKQTARASQLMHQVLEAQAGEAASDEVFITLVTDRNGNVTALTANTLALTALKARFLTALDRSLTRELAGPVTLHLGDLTNLSSLAGRGPAICAGCPVAWETDARFTSGVRSTGINQTVYQIRFTAALHLSDGKTIRIIQTDISVAETILVGAVPGG